MPRPRKCGWSHIVIAVSLYAAVFPSAPLFVQSTSTSPSTSFSFPVFPSADDFIIFGKTRHNPDKLSFTINATRSLTIRSACVKFFYMEPVRMKTRESNGVASFSTSFTFSITQDEQSINRSTGWLPKVCGLILTFASENITSLFGGYADPNFKFFGVEFDTYLSYMDEDPSDNHIGVDINNLTSSHTYNLCNLYGNPTPNCLFPWTGRVYTAWIDYNGSARSLEVWFANGSMADGVRKPTGSGLLKVPELDLMDIFEEYMYVGFFGSSGPYLDTYEILSWNFESSLYTEEMPAATSISRRAVVIWATAGAATLVAICLLGYWKKQSEMKKSPEPGIRVDLLMGLRRFSFKELKKATNNFNEGALLGKGGSGSVYKGTLTPSGMVVAVKRLTHHDSENVEREFLAEVSSISQIRHRNLVQLKGWCREADHFLLVFDYMSNGSLDEWLFPYRRRYPGDPKYKKFEVLPWELRVSILAGIAAAVEYLHEECVQCVLHRDIKSSNVMLDADFNPHLGDFGLARLIDHEKLEKTTMVAGTFGYMAPEMHYTGKATRESDVYSFGILMLEVVCGRRPIDLQVEDPGETFMLLQGVWRAHETGNILSALDPRLLNLHSPQHKPSSYSIAASDQISLLSNSWEEGRIVPLLYLGLQCSLLDPESRPSMRVVKQVIMHLQGSAAEESITALNLMPPLPSTMPLHGDLQPGSCTLQAPNASMTSTKTPLEEVKAPLLPKSSSLTGLRRRFITC